MKKMIDMRLYDTENAEKIAECKKYDNLETYLVFKEELYKTKNGNYFLFGFGFSFVNDDLFKTDDNIVVASIPEIISWYDERNYYFDDKSREKFLEEFGKIFFEG